MNPGAELAWRPPRRRRSSRAREAVGPRSVAAFQAPPLAQRIPPTPVAASVDTPRAPTSASSGGSGASSTQPGYLLAVQAWTEVSRDAGPGPIGEYLVEQGRMTMTRVCRACAAVCRNSSR